MGNVTKGKDGKLYNGKGTQGGAVKTAKEFSAVDISSIKIDSAKAMIKEILGGVEVPANEVKLVQYNYNYETISEYKKLSEAATNNEHKELYNTLAEIVENDGKAEFDGLFDLDGNLVPAKLIDTRFGRAWGILSEDKPNAKVSSWFNPSNSINTEVAQKNNAKKGYYVGKVKAPAFAKIENAGKYTYMPYVEVYRIDGGYSSNPIIVDNGYKAF